MWLISEFLKATPFMSTTPLLTTITCLSCLKEASLLEWGELQSWHIFLLTQVVFMSEVTMDPDKTIVLLKFWPKATCYEDLFCNHFILTVLLSNE